MNEDNIPTKAVALTYDGNKAPFVSASASDDLAAEILKIAREHEVPIYENEQLVETLAQLEVGEEIPELLYRTIAEIIAFVYILKGKAPEKEAAPYTKAPEDFSKTEENNILSIGTTIESVKSLPEPPEDSD
ncbi:MAG: EscU/YscU/HrcU family type III secretion system export apparatus switch protein [Pseudomonadales bacterium]|nr:EscU/YscU/HrcU family type III secretion system export apparatus switch protein [Pseudomonadales bacterium]